MTSLNAKMQFLSVLPPTIRGACFNYFLIAARGGVEFPSAIVENVALQLERRITGGSQGEAVGNARLMMQAIQNDPDGALVCAQAALEHDARPPEEKVAEREQAKAEGVERWMRGQPATLKQIRALTDWLDYRGPAPKSMAEARNLFDKIQGGRR